jgi:ribonucleoside-diphosphate reductase alpha chain
LRDAKRTQGITAAFSQPLAAQIWQAKYRYATAGIIIDQTLDDTWARVAKGLVAHEALSVRDKVAAEFHAAMRDFKVLPGGANFVGLWHGPPCDPVQYLCDANDP